MRTILAAGISALIATAALGQTKQQIGRWVADARSTPQPIVSVSLPSTGGAAIFSIACLQADRRWFISLRLQQTAFPPNGRVRIAMYAPVAPAVSLEMTTLDHNTVFAFFDKNPDDVFKAVHLFTVTEVVTVTILSDFPAQPITASFSTTGASEATRIPIATCSQP